MLIQKGSEAGDALLQLNRINSFGSRLTSCFLDCFYSGESPSTMASSTSAPLANDEKSLRSQSFDVVTSVGAFEVELGDSALENHA